jgi:hypothetical protein
MRVVPLIILMLALGVATAAAAPPDALPSSARLTGQVPTQTPGERSAQLELRGFGTAQLNGRLVVYGKVEYADLIAVKDWHGDARLFFEGRQYWFKRGWVGIKRASGRFYVQGRDIRVKIKGREMSIALAGNGRARLQGSGSFRLNGGASLPWVSRWINVKPGASPPRASRRKKKRAPASSRNRGRRVVLAR